MMTSSLTIGGVVLLPRDSNKNMDNSMGKDDDGGADERDADPQLHPQ